MSTPQDNQQGQTGQQTQSQQQYGYNPYPYPPMPPQGYNPYQPQIDPQTGQPVPYPYPPMPPQGYNPYQPQIDPQTGQPVPYPYPPMPPQGYNPYQYPIPPQGQQPTPPPPPEPVTQPIGSFGADDSFITKIKLPPHSLQIDENVFLKLLSGSISLTKEEKKRIILATGQLTQFQIDELISILQEEKNKFSALDIKHKAQLDELQATHKLEWEALEIELTQEDAKKEESKALEKARKAMQQQ